MKKCKKKRKFRTVITLNEDKYITPMESPAPKPVKPKTVSGGKNVYR